MRNIMLIMAVLAIVFSNNYEAFAEGTTWIVGTKEVISSVGDLEIIRCVGTEPKCKVCGEAYAGNEGTYANTYSFDFDPGSQTTGKGHTNGTLIVAYDVVAGGYTYGFEPGIGDVFYTDYALWLVAIGE